MTLAVLKSLLSQNKEMDKVEDMVEGKRDRKGNKNNQRNRKREVFIIYQGFVRCPYSITSIHCVVHLTVIEKTKSDLVSFGI